MKTTASERIPVLVSAREKAQIARMAKEAGVSMGEYLRRAVAAFNPQDNDAAIEGMIDQVLKTTDAANHAIDEALHYVEQSNLRIAALEAEAQRQRKAA